jgi:hypothetical protein
MHATFNLISLCIKIYWHEINIIILGSNRMLPFCIVAKNEAGSTSSVLIYFVIVSCHAHYKSRKNVIFFQLV